jgi:PAS domain S-box-containing protein
VSPGPLDPAAADGRASGRPPGGEEWCRQALDALPAAVYATDAHGRITYFNEAAATLAGRRPELGQDEWCVSWRLFHLDGTPMAHDECPMAVALKEGRRVWGEEAILERPDGTRIVFQPWPTPLHDASGVLVGAVNMLVDITHRKAADAELRTSEQRYRELSETLEERVAERTRELEDAVARERASAAEREEVEAALRQAQKMEAVGQLTSGVAHDFNNLLTAIVGNLELLDMRLHDERLRKLVQAAARSAQRGAKLNAQMLAFSRKQHLTPRSVDLSDLIASIEEMLRRTLGGTVDVTTALVHDSWRALVDPHQLELAILNLAINARDAMPLGGRLRIEVRNVKASELDGSIELAPGDYVRLSVADTGTGMGEEVLARACEPFYTTKEAGKGSGLGLSQVYGFARQSGGGLRIKSTVGRGTTVEVYLPRSLAEADPATERWDGKRPSLAPGRATVLVVEDQEDVREVAVVQLEALGYRVVQAASGDAALDVLNSATGIDLLMVDYAMPGMSGIDVASAARAKCPDLPVLIVTGYIDTARMDGKIQGARLMRKPYRMAELADAVEYLLRGESAGTTNVVGLRAAGD